MAIYVSEHTRQHQRGQDAEKSAEFFSMVAEALKSAHKDGSTPMHPVNPPSAHASSDFVQKVFSETDAAKSSSEKSRQYVMRRQGGAVERCHTIPHQGSYSNGLHSYNAAQLCLVFHPSPSLALIKAILDHDVAEFVVGDMPSTMKIMSPAIAVELQNVEDRVEERFGLHTYLTMEEKRWLKACDLMELYLWTIDQLAMGNGFATMIHENIMNNGFHPDRVQKTLPPELYIFFAEYIWSPINSLTSLAGGPK